MMVKKNNVLQEELQPKHPLDLQRLPSTEYRLNYSRSKCIFPLPPPHYEKVNNSLFILSRNPQRHPPTSFSLNKVVYEFLEISLETFLCSTSALPPCPMTIGSSGTLQLCSALLTNSNAHCVFSVLLLVACNDSYIQ